MTWPLRCSQNIIFFSDFRRRKTIPIPLYVHHARAGVVTTIKIIIARNGLQSAGIVYSSASSARNRVRRRLWNDTRRSLSSVAELAPAAAPAHPSTARGKIIFLGRYNSNTRRLPPLVFESPLFFPHLFFTAFPHPRNPSRSRLHPPPHHVIHVMTCNVK